MRIEDSPDKHHKQMAGTIENNSNKNRTMKLKEVVKVSPKLNNTANIHTEFKENLQQTPQIKKNINSGNKHINSDVNQKEKSDIINQFADLSITADSDPTHLNSSHSNIATVTNHQNAVSETDEDVATTSKSSKARSNSTNNTVQKQTDKSKKPKQKKNKRKKKSASQVLTSEERASFNAYMNHIITKEVQRSSKNKIMQEMKENNSRIHRMSQGESLDSCNGVDETTGDTTEYRKPKKLVNGVCDFSDSVQSLTDNGESLPCSAYSDFPSEDSASDSGKGGSDIQFGPDIVPTCDELVATYTFEVPQELCGALIGKRGRLINGIQDQTNTKILVREQYSLLGAKLCTIEGTENDIKKALSLIRKRFPISQFSNLTLQQIIFTMQSIQVTAETMQLRIPEGVCCEVIVSSMVTPSHIFLQQPTHPTYPSLSSLDHMMTAWYTKVEAPGIASPQEGNLCATPGVNGWYRARIVHVYESKECEVMFVDYGGFGRIQSSCIRQIRGDFFTLPFQAQECCLSNVVPANGSDRWDPQSFQVFDELVKGSVLQAYIVGYSCETGVPLIQLFKTIDMTSICINRELVNRSVADWVEYVCN